MIKSNKHHTCNEEQSGLLQLLQEHDALSLMTSGEDNEYSSGDDALPEWDLLGVTEYELRSCSLKRQRERLNQCLLIRMVCREKSRER